MACVYLGQSRQAHLLNHSPISSQPPISPKSFACHTYKNKGLKVLCLPHIRKRPGGPLTFFPLVVFLCPVPARPESGASTGNSEVTAPDPSPCPAGCQAAMEDCSLRHRPLQRRRTQILECLSR